MSRVGLTDPALTVIDLPLATRAVTIRAVAVSDWRRALQTSVSHRRFLRRLHMAAAHSPATGRKQGCRPLAVRPYATTSTITPLPLDMQTSAMASSAMSSVSHAVIELAPPCSQVAALDGHFPSLRSIPGCVATTLSPRVSFACMNSLRVNYCLSFKTSAPKAAMTAATFALQPGSHPIQGWISA